MKFRSSTATVAAGEPERVVGTGNSPADVTGEKRGPAKRRSDPKPSVASPPPLHRPGYRAREEEAACLWSGVLEVGYNFASPVSEATMPSNAALLDGYAAAAALTGAAVATDRQAYAAAAIPGEHVALRRIIEARMMPGFRSMDTCPEGGWVWVRGGPFNEPKLRTARGEQWRRDKREGKPAPTYWAPVLPPAWDEA